MHFIHRSLTVIDNFVSVEAQSYHSDHVQPIVEAIAISPSRS